MIAIVYGAAGDVWLEPIALDLQRAIESAGGAALAISIEALARRRSGNHEIDRVYVLPFDPPAERTAEEYLYELLPAARPIISFAVQDLCWDKIATQERLLGRGLSMPATVITSQPRDVAEFVRRHEYAIIKHPSSCGGSGHFVVWYEDGELLADCGSHRYRMQLVAAGEPSLTGDLFALPAPYYVQRLVGERGRKGLQPPQVLRAYIADEQVRFWTERYRDSYARPSDFIVNLARGARYRMLHEVSEDARKAAVRAADILGMRFGAIDFVRTSQDGPLILEAECDSYHVAVDRQFKQLPEYRDVHDFDTFIAQALVGDEELAREQQRDLEARRAAPEPRPRPPRLPQRREPPQPRRPDRRRDR